MSSWWGGHGRISAFVRSDWRAHSQERPREGTGRKWALPASRGFTLGPDLRLAASTTGREKENAVWVKPHQVWSFVTRDQPTRHRVSEGKTGAAGCRWGEARTVWAYSTGSVWKPSRRLAKLAGEGIPTWGGGLELETHTFGPNSEELFTAFGGLHTPSLSITGPGCSRALLPAYTTRQERSVRLRNLPRPGALRLIQSKEGKVCSATRGPLSP